MSWNDAAMRSVYLLYLQGAANCAQIPGGCSGVVIPPPPTPAKCPDSSIAIQPPTLSIQKIAPNNPLVVGQDPEERRGADVQIAVTVPPVIFTWYEPIYEEEDICREPGAGEMPNCRQSWSSTINDGVADTELVFKECCQHIERLPDAIRTVQATANLSGDSQTWIKGQLGQTHYGAYVRKPSFALIPGPGTYSASCDGGGTRPAAPVTRSPLVCSMRQQ